MNRTLRNSTWSVLAIGWCCCAAVVNFAHAIPSGESSNAARPIQGGNDVMQRLASIADPAKVLSADACVKCHAAEVNVWKNTPHSKTFEQLHRTPEAKQIARRLGVRSIKYDGRCVACHYTQQMDEGRAVTVAGVSCESCHGAATDWLDVHQDYGGPTVTRQTESAAHRAARIAESVARGMRNPQNVFAMAQSCYRCHTVQDEELVNVGGHNAGSTSFEFVSWSQGLVRHNFVRSGGTSNASSSTPRMRVMLVAGMFADLEASLRATAKATEVATYGTNAALRAARAAARLRSVQEKVEHPLIGQAIEIFDQCDLSIDNGPELSQAADRIAELGYEFAESVDPETLGALDAFIPRPEQWK